MAYSTATPPRLLMQGVGGVGPNFWTYRNTDADTAVDGASYITNGGDLGMKVGDILFYTKTDASPIATFIFNVTTVSATAPGAVDLSNATVITATNSD